MGKPINFVQTEALFIADKKEFCLNVNISKYFFFLVKVHLEFFLIYLIHLIVNSCIEEDYEGGGGCWLNQYQKKTKHFPSANYFS